jgi:hypothetical protein
MKLPKILAKYGRFYIRRKESRPRDWRDGKFCAENMCVYSTHLIDRAVSDLGLLPTCTNEASTLLFADGVRKKVKMLLHLSMPRANQRFS